MFSTATCISLVRQNAALCGNESNDFEIVRHTLRDLFFSLFFFSVKGQGRSLCYHGNGRVCQEAYLLI